MAAARVGPSWAYGLHVLVRADDVSVRNASGVTFLRESAGGVPGAGARCCEKDGAVLLLSGDHLGVYDVYAENPEDAQAKIGDGIVATKRLRGDLDHIADFEVPVDEVKGVACPLGEAGWRRAR